MWNTQVIEKFIVDKNIDSNRAKEIIDRMKRIADGKGNFSSLSLREVMGDKELASKLEDAWNSGELLSALL